MYKVLLVDDEFFAREALRTTVAWETFNCTVCGEAKNGLEGVEKAHKLNPDIVIVDINMPIMDGLTMIEKLRKPFPDTIFIILTGYSEFEYAKRGIELGLRYFLIKPVDSSQMEETLQKAVEYLDNQKKWNLEYQSYRFWATEDIEGNRRRFLELLLKSEKKINPDHFAFECERLKLPLQDGGYAVCVLIIDSRTFVNQSSEVWQQMVEEMLEPIHEWNCTVYYRGKGFLYLLLSNLKQEMIASGEVEDLLQKIQICFMQKWVCTVKAGVGTYCKNYDQISQSSLAAEQTVHSIHVSAPIEKMLSIIHQNYGDPDLNLKEIANQLFVSYSYLSTQFTKEMGMSASRYISVYRMAKAADALREGNRNMAEIAVSVGYPDIKYFYHVFKKRYNMTPNQYVDMIRKSKSMDL